MKTGSPVIPDVVGDVAARNSAMTISGHAIHIRDRRFVRTNRPRHWWLNDDPIATAWHNGLSSCFPRGEAFFVESVKACSENTPPRLAAQIRDFVRQEVNHSREHLAFNRAVEGAGYDLSESDRRVAELLAMADNRPPIVNLAMTMALEHFTAMMAHIFLSDPRHFAGADDEVVALWRWHAVEELEHKAVAYDTFLHATRRWSRWRRWRLKSLAMLIVTKNFLHNRTRDALDLLSQDGITGWRTKGRLAYYLLVKPGVLRRIIPAWIAYFLPGFHPWNTDDRLLIDRYENGDGKVVPKG